MEKVAQTLIFCWLLMMTYHSKKSEWQIKIVPTAGFIVNTDNIVNLRKNQSGPFNAFFINFGIVNKLDLEEEE